MIYKRLIESARLLSDTCTRHTKVYPLSLFGVCKLDALCFIVAHICRHTEIILFFCEKVSMGYAGKTGTAHNTVKLVLKFQIDIESTAILRRQSDSGGSICAETFKLICAELNIQWSH